MQGRRDPQKEILMVGIRDVTGPNLRRLFGSLVFILVIGTQITSAKALKVRFDAPSIFR